jgi:hypothetical protein
MALNSRYLDVELTVDSITNAIETGMRVAIGETWKDGSVGMWFGPFGQIAIWTNAATLGPILFPNDTRDE